MRERAARRLPAGPSGWRLEAFQRLLVAPWVLALMVIALACSGDPVPDGSSQGLSEARDQAPNRPELSEAASSQVYPLQIRDAAGNTLSLPAPPQRILSLVPSVTRVVQALGAESRLVGRTEYDADPGLARLPSVGGGLEPNMEALALLEPDLVIRFAGESDPETPVRLTELGIPHLAIRLDQVADVEGVFRDLGTILEAEEAAAREIEEIRSMQERIGRAVADADPVRVAYVLGGDPPWVAGAGTYIDELLTLAGGTNVFTDLSKLYGPVSTEEFLVLEIDVVLAPEGVELELPDAGFPVMRVSADLELPGPDLATSVLEVATLLHPERFR